MVIYKHITESMTYGLFGLLYVDEMDMKIVHWMAWKANLFAAVFFSSIHYITCLLRLLQPASYALGYLACDHRLFFSQIWPDLSGMMKKVYYDQTWWLLMESNALFEVSPYVITTLNSWISFFGYVNDIVCSSWGKYRCILTTS